MPWVLPSSLSSTLPRKVTFCDGPAPPPPCIWIMSQCSPPLVCMPSTRLPTTMRPLTPENAMASSVESTKRFPLTCTPLDLATVSPL